MKYKKLKKTIALLVSCVLVFSVLAGCGKDSGSTDTNGNLTKVTLNEVAHSIFYAPMYVAIEKGYFAEEGIDLTLVTGFGADKTMTALLTGEADIGFMGSEASIYTYIGGASDKIINFAQLTQRAGNFVVAREPIDNFTFDMMVGKDVIGGRAGGMPQMVFEFILKKNGICPQTDVNIDQGIDFGLTAAAFSSGQGDFSVEFEPHATALELKGDGFVVASLGENSGFIPYTAFSAKASYIEANEDVIMGFTRALQKGMDFVNSNTPADIATAIKGQFPETDDEALKMIVTRYYEQGTWKKDLIFTEDAFTLMLNILEEAGAITQRVPYEELVITRFAEAVLK